MTRDLDRFLLTSALESRSHPRGRGRWALGAVIDSKAAQQLGDCAVSDVFASSCARDDHDSRVVRVSGVRQIVRIRSEALWCGLHWADRSILCSGSNCVACERGWPLRRYAMVAVDRPGQSMAVLQLTERDLCLLTTLNPSSPESMKIGSQFRVWRSESRQPMSAEYLGVTENLLVIPRETAMVNVLRIHGIRATEADVRTGGFRRLVALKVADMISPSKVLA